MNREQRLKTIQTTEKALELLQIVANGAQGMNIQDLSKKLHISREEVLLLLVTMENKGLVSWDSGRRIYSPGGATLEMVKNLTQRFPRSRVALMPAPLY